MAKDGTNRGGRRVRAGDKPDALADKIARGKAAQVMDLPISDLDGADDLGPVSDLTGADMPHPSDYLSAKQRDGEPLGADIIFNETIRWLKERGCDRLVNPRLVESYSEAFARYIQCSEAVSNYGLLGKHPTTKAPIASPFVQMMLSFQKQANPVLDLDAIAICEFPLSSLKHLHADDGWMRLLYKEHMGILSGLFHSRDKPTNATSGSSYRFFLGGSTSGKTVTERSAMQMTAVYSCVMILAEAIAGLPLHLYTYKEDGGKEKAIGHPLYLLLHDEPNPEMSSFVFRETLMTHLLLWGNAYAQIIRNGKGEVVALYPLMPNRMTVDRDSSGQLFYSYQMNNSDAPTMKAGTVILKSSFSNIEQQSLEFVKYTLDPWVVRWEQSLSRALFTPEEKKQYFFKFNVEGLLRGDYQSRMNGYATARQNGWMSANDIRELENLDRIPAEEGGDLYLILGIRYDPCFMIPADKIGIDQTDIATEETLATPRNSFQSMNRKSYCIRRQSSSLTSRA